MIFSLSGTLALKTDAFIVVDCNGVGYQVFIPYTVIASLPSQGETLDIYTFHAIREDSQQLFGFMTIEDREFFVLLTSVSGVGPKVGLKIMSEMTSDQLVHAILSGNIAALTQISGVGKKMAERLIIELKDKLSKLDFVRLPDDISVKGSGAVSLSKEYEQDLILALKTLGYSSEEIKRAVRSAGAQLKDSFTLEESIKVLLKFL